MPRVVDATVRRAQITDGVARVIARSGIEAATMREVAMETGWSTGVLTHYFSDKREMLLATFQESLGRRHAMRAAESGEDPMVRLRRSLEGALVLDDQQRRHWLVTLACVSYAAGDEEFAASQRAAYRGFRDFVSALVVAAHLAEGPDAVVVAERAIAAADGVAIQALFDPESWSPARQLAHLETSIQRLRPSSADWTAQGSNHRSL